MLLQLNLALLAFTAQNVQLGAAKVNSVCQDPGWSSMRPCAAYCLGCDGRSDQMVYWLECGSPFPNECYCSTDLFALATSKLQSYCLGAGFTALGVIANAPATTTANPNAPTVTKVTLVTETVSSTGSRAPSALVSITAATKSTTSQVTVDATSTVRVDTKGNPVGKLPDGLSTSDQIALAHKEEMIRL
ncbi:hypothetical protein B0T18DRAFT_392658 [Schizothecium vesticola]|uniref:Extracellular membrane protein CFEM domain-containing protein n=1 Tax=Schizothecium vesticola TaxID=314040 RepID=A0AA40ER89_9PEZI|nr:hypothetical protein B0T18DRAFT_392658 [Schizothecium vesticola]